MSARLAATLGNDSSWISSARMLPSFLARHSRTRRTSGEGAALRAAANRTQDECVTFMAANLFAETEQVSSTLAFWSACLLMKSYKFRHTCQLRRRSPSKISASWPCAGCRAWCSTTSTAAPSASGRSAKTAARSRTCCSARDRRWRRPLRHHHHGAGHEDRPAHRPRARRQQPHVLSARRGRSGGRRRRCRHHLHRCPRCRDARSKT